MPSIAVRRAHSHPRIPSPLNLTVVNDYAVVVAGVEAVLAPYADRVRVHPERWPHLAADLDVVLYDPYATLASEEDEVFARVRTHDRARLVVYSWGYDARRVQHALRAGADGYLSKRLEPHQLVTALELIVAGETVTPGRQRLGFGGSLKDERKRPSRLGGTPRRPPGNEAI